MAESTTLARPYAKAIFDLAQSDSTFDSWTEALAALDGAISDPQVRSLIGHPGLTRGDLAAALVEALGGAASGVQNLVRLLAQNGRLLLIGAIRSQYESLRAAAEGRIDVQITTATQIASEQQTLLTDAIAKRLALRVDVQWDQDEALIAGAVVRAGDLVIDGSVAGELDRLRQHVAG